MSEWAGGVELEPTDLYGMRIYQVRGADLSAIGHSGLLRDRARMAGGLSTHSLT